MYDSGRAFHVFIRHEHPDGSGPHWLYSINVEANYKTLYIMVVIYYYAGLSKPLAQTATGARLTCLTTFNPNSATSARQAAREAAASKAKARETDTNPPPQEPQKKEQPKGSRPAALAGIAHDGVVEFPDEEERGAGKKRKKGGQSVKKPAGNVPLVQAKRVNLKKKGPASHKAGEKGKS